MEHKQNQVSNIWQEIHIIREIMSVWVDMHRRSNGETVRKEDIPIQEEEDRWRFNEWYNEILEKRKKERLINEHLV